MKKFSMLVMFCLLIVCSSVSAQDIYATSKDGYDYYVVSETINNQPITYQSPETGKIFHGSEITFKVKLVMDGKLINVQNWKFGGFVGHAANYTINGVKKGLVTANGANYAFKTMTISS